MGLLFEVFRTNQLTGRLVAEALEPTGMRGDDYAVYSFMLHGPVTLTRLAEGTGMPLTTTAGYVKRFDDRGHLIRSPNPADRRSQLLSLTDECRSWVLDVAAIFWKTVSHLEDDLVGHNIDIDALIGELRKLQDGIERTLET